MKEHIEPEELELYALGALDAAERGRIEQALTGQPALRKELSNIESELEQFTSLYARNPAPALRAKIMESVSADKPSATTRPTGFAAAAAISVVAIGIALWCGYKWQKEAELTTALQAQNTLMSAAMNDEQNQRKAAEKLLSTLQAAKVGAFTALAPSGEVKGQLYWNRSKQEALFVATAVAGQLTVSLYRNNELAAVSNATSEGVSSFYKFSLPEGIDSLRIADGAATQGMFGEARVKFQDEKPPAKSPRAKQPLLPKTGL